MPPIKGAALARALATSPALALLTTGAMAQSGSPVQLDPLVVQGGRAESLTVPSTMEAREIVQRTPGAVEVVPDTAWRDGQATTLKNVLDYVPGVFVQPKWGEDSRLSIRGSGLSRNFHLRGVALYVDGIPINAADGSGDFQEIDPTAFRYVEVYKGANGLRFGANALGGAVNFVSPTGLDAGLLDGRVDVGSYGFWRLQGSSGFKEGDVDGFLTGSWMEQDGFRDHSTGQSGRASGNVGWRIAENAETRFYLHMADLRQEIPGSVTRTAALSNPKKAAPNNILQHYQRNMTSFRAANRTTVKIGTTTFEVGGYAVDKHLIHPIFQYLDYRYHDFAGFGRLEDERLIGGHRNRVTAGVTYANGWIDNKQYVNLPGGKKGNLLSASRDAAQNTTVYAENAFDVVPGVSLIAGMQYVSATRRRGDRFPDAVDTSGSNSYDLFSPKVGVLWQVDPGWQVFANVSRSAEAPSFGDLNFTNAALSDTKAQKATTFEVGTRGRRPDYAWDVALYRMNLKDELQFFDLGGGSFQVTNADRTIHQGLELGGSWAFAKGVLAPGADPDRLWLNLAYTFSDFRFDGDKNWGDNDLPGAPRHYLRAELLYRHPAGFYAGPNVEWVPQAYYVDNAYSTKTKSYALLGFRAGYDVDDHVSLFVDARNLLDEKYISSASVVAVANPTSALYEPGNGIAVYGGVGVRW